MRADCAVIEHFINYMPLYYATCRRPKRCYPLCGVATLENAFAAQVKAGCEYVIIILTTLPVSQQPGSLLHLSIWVVI